MKGKDAFFESPHYLGPYSRQQAEELVAESMEMEGRRREMNDAVVARWLRDLATMTPGYRQSHLGFAAEIQHYLLQVAEAIETDHLVDAQCSICGKRAYGERAFAWLIPEEREVSHRCDDCQDWLDRARERAKGRAAIHTLMGSPYR